MEMVKAVKCDLMTATSEKETSDLVKEELGKQLARALEKVESLKSEIQTAISEKSKSDFEKTKIEGRLANAMEELATKNRATLSTETQTTMDLLELSNWEVRTYEMIAEIDRLYDIIQEKYNIKET